MDVRKSFDKTRQNKSFFAIDAKAGIAYDRWQRRKCHVGRKKRMGNPAVTWNGRKVPEENASDRSSLDDGMRRSDWSSYVMGCLPTDIEEASR